MSGRYASYWNAFLFHFQSSFEKFDRKKLAGIIFGVVSLQRKILDPMYQPISRILSSIVKRQKPWQKGKTRWCPRGIQRLVSTYDLQTNSNSKCHHNFHLGGGVLQTNSNSKCQDLPKFSFSGAGGGGTPDQHS